MRVYNISFIAYGSTYIYIYIIALWTVTDSEKIAKDVEVHLEEFGAHFGNPTYIRISPALAEGDYVDLDEVDPAKLARLKQVSKEHLNEHTDQYFKDIGC